ncbi:MAG TPA: OFA family MFS transporter [Terriglobales bacterium]|nr:OFA family MFS transporter [Terriglobales bacterium]HUK47221.1 OFA family MFS transporter [Terriglobales bacterium]
MPAINNPATVSNSSKSSEGTVNRWGIAVAGVIMQIALGAVYAWSVFRIPLTKAFGWTISQVTLTFTIAILVLGFAAFVGGVWMRRSGPRRVAIVAGFFYGAGVFLASFSGGHLWWLYFSYGILGGTGIGLGYIVPVATLVKWFPDKRGMITGIAVAGFGAGALITAPIASRLIVSVGVLKTFAILGIAYFLGVTIPAFFMKDPPAGFAPAGWKPSAAQVKQRTARDYTLPEALGKWQWYVLWAMLFLNTSAGISIISQAAPMAQEITHVTALLAAGMVGIISIANGAGRFLWAWLSDAIGRRAVFFSMFLVQAVVFWVMPHVSSFGVFTTLAFIVLLCYGGGFGTMPAFAADYFGPTNVGSVYGLMLTAWGFAGVFGPMLIANIRQTTGHYVGALNVIAIVVIVSAILPLITRPPKEEKRVANVSVQAA